MSSRIRYIQMAGLVNSLIYPAKVCKTGSKATVQIPHLGLDDMSRTGKITPWRIIAWMAHSRWSAFHRADPENGMTFLEFNKMTEDMFTFFVSSQTIINSEFYSTLRQCAPLSVDMHLGYIGTSSLNTVATLRESDSDKVLATNTNQVVLVDRQTRRPTSIPLWWAEKYRPTVVENESLVIRRFQVSLSESAYKYRMKVTWSDIDAYRHTNYLSYAKFCFDAAMDAVNKHYYSHFSGDILLYDVKAFNLSFLGESKAGDEIEISTWQDQTNPSILYFSFDKHGSIIFQSSIEFYDKMSSNL